MPLDPFLAELLKNLPAAGATPTDYTAYRATERQIASALTEQLAEPYPEVQNQRRIEIPVEGGTIELLIYTPDTEGPHTGYVFFFGGGFRGGSPEHEYVDGSCRERCIGGDAVVVSVGYRLAPEHKFPTAANDAYAALTWVAEHADELGIDPSRIVVGGQSAGGNLAASIALRASNEGGPAIALQILEVPALDLTWETALTEYSTGYILELTELHEIERVLFNNPDEAKNPYASPLLAEDLSGVAPAVILTSEFDLTRGSAEAYARRLEAAGVPVTYKMFPGQIHASPMMTKALEPAREWRADVTDVLRSVTTTA